MATPMVPGSSQPFSRIVETRRTSSWAAAVPAAILLVAAVVLIAWFAAKASEYSQQLTNTRNQLAQQTQTVNQMQQRAVVVEGDMARLRNAGRTTVILRAATPPPARGRRAAAQETSGAWGAATWGEQPDGKTWLRMEAYGLTAPQGKTLDLWFVPTQGAPVLASKIDPGQDGSAFVEGKDLPGLSDGKRLIISADAEDAKQPGDVIAQADLPQLKGGGGQAAAQPAK